MKGLTKASMTYTFTHECNGNLGLHASLSVYCTASQTVLLSHTKCYTEKALFWEQIILL